MELIQQIDQQTFLAINGLWSPLSDQCWILITNRFFWIPLYLFLALLLYKTLGKKIWLFLLSVVLMISLSDQGANFAKKNFKRLRPCHEPAIADRIHTPSGCGGKYGYFSGHASNAAAISTIIILLMHERRMIVFLMSSYSLLVGLSRIFLGAHYPFDILSGFLWGTIVGYIFYRLYTSIYNRWLLKS
ncbi:MAG: hypothetical protein RLZZ46_1444 [Bacteroidota bacterium]|jgi:undecaprenyl-diphosphatase